MHEGTASAGGTPWVCRHFTLRAAAFLRGCASGARTPRCAWRSSVCAPDDNPREPDRSRSLAPIAHTHGPRDRSAARRPRCAEHAAAGAFGASAHMRRGRNGHRPCPSAVSIGRVHRPCPSAVSIGRVHRRPRRGPKKKRRPQDAVHCMRPQCPPDDARQAATRPQARAPSVAEAARAEPQSEARGTTTRAASQRGRVAPRPLRSESRLAYFFSGSLPGGVAGLNGNELNMVFAWFCICSCICTNMFFDCSM
ncbi:hypothetical protein DR61_2014 [Burkholderia pseudomallei]|nr:hypothetical protein DR61_2014 [Burkholderia pseudomallei]CAJ2796930.1 Uncharacterised protein [Burkholderia pseudomallei]CAJ2850103.1 Uncharacterised protein [Burkholderia pseudomallei]CAJ2925450.1 Uncharacterised protein [Burkholderia pseudomallei]CAJ3061613.1 Uncharacterised protein [Burkholderia pseudomallei]